MPVHAFVDVAPGCSQLGLRNYWGYDTIGYFAPEGRYSSPGTAAAQVVEFKEMVKALHAAGLEVILDVVYNHTGGGQPPGPDALASGASTTRRTTASTPTTARHYWDVTGTGNTLNAGAPQTLRLIMDSLRYWVTEMHVDGFRFDLASALARQFYEVDRLAAFFDIIHQDPVLAEVKLIAEPWDIGPGGYQVGNFPVGWAEWNGKYRDTRARLLAGRRPRSRRPRLPAHRQSATSTTTTAAARAPASTSSPRTTASPCADLVSYNAEAQRGQRRGQPRRHRRQPLLELRRRGRDRRPRRCVALRAPPAAQLPGHPAALPGRAHDPRRATSSAARQRGNNNAYCQDNEISWLDWATPTPSCSPSPGG